MKKTHGESDSPNHPETVEHRAWAHMKHRCFNPNNKYWKNYGGRGITVDSRQHGVAKRRALSKMSHLPS